MIYLVMIDTLGSNHVADAIKSELTPAERKDANKLGYRAFGIEANTPEQAIAMTLARQLGAGEGKSDGALDVESQPDDISKRV